MVCEIILYIGLGLLHTICLSASTCSSFISSIVISISQTLSLMSPCGPTLSPWNTALANGLPQRLCFSNFLPTRLPKV